VKSVRIMLVYLVVGACAFWVPDIAVHAVARNQFSGLDAIGLTVCLPVFAYVVLLVIWKKRGSAESFGFAALPAVVGTWLFGPLMMTFTASFGGGGVYQPGWSQTVILCTGLFPLCDIDMSTYDGTLFALFIVTAGLPITALFVKRRTAPTPLPASK